MSMLDTDVPIFRQDPTDPAFVQDPYRFYVALRAQGDFVRWEDYGHVMATTQRAVSQVLKHPNMGRAVPEDKRGKAPAGLAAFRALEAHSLLELEPPDHTRLRRLAVEGFGGSRVSPIAPRVSKLADRLIDAFPGEGAFDLIDAYAKPLAALTITEFLGVPQEDAEQLQAWSNDMVAVYQARRDAAVDQRAETAASDFTAYIRDELERRQHLASDDFISLLVSAAEAGQISRDELVSTAILLLNAGHEATVHTIGNAVDLLTKHSARDVALQPESIASTVEECLRFRPPLHLFTRYVYAPVTLDGIAFAPGDRIGCLLASACRDDAVWPDGEKFDPFRIRRPHTAFGLGLHACVGASLARLELQIALPALFSRCPGLSVAEPPRVADLYHFHGFERLMVSLRQAARGST